MIPRAGGFKDLHNAKRVFVLLLVFVLWCQRIFIGQQSGRWRLSTKRWRSKVVELLIQQKRPEMLPFATMTYSHLRYSCLWIATLEHLRSRPKLICFHSSTAGRSQSGRILRSHALAQLDAIQCLVVILQFSVTRNIPSSQQRREISTLFAPDI